ncbi:unnamed protein product [Acanthocheilonema viteae]|uniref:Uncharacterized protein n=1 Tax=Acanthocheilonema viteae TaxID=6277 RepID=A0A498SNA4_ACAVI|nr:unnamed protein product [Acanthocheilonema viteae]
MVQPAVSDPTAALLAFSKSFKKVRRAKTIKPIRYIKQKSVNDASAQRSTSLPNPDDLYIVVRDNDKRSSARKISALEEMKMHKSRYQKYRCNSLFATTLPLHHHSSSSSSSSSSSFILNNENCAKEYFGSYLQANESIIDPSNGTDDNTTKLLKSTLMLITKLSLYDTMKQFHKPTLLETDNAGNSSSAFYRNIDAMPNMNISRTKKTIPLVSELLY